MVMIEAMEDVGEGVRLGGELLKDIKFANDQGMVAQTEKGLQTIMDGLSKTEKEYDMKIKVKKTKVMRVCRNGSKSEGGNSIMLIHTSFIFGALISSHTRLAVCHTFSVFSRI